MSLFCLSSLRTSYDIRGMRLTKRSKSMDDGDRTVTSCPLPTKSRTAAGTVPSPSHEEMMNTGLPRLNLAASELVTAEVALCPEALHLQVMIRS